MKKWRKGEKEVRGDIMKTDVYVQVLSENRTEQEIKSDIDEAFSAFQLFEKQMSRFDSESELSKLNERTDMVVSAELFDLLARCRQYFRETEGVFDPAVLLALKREGYSGSYGSEKFGLSEEKNGMRYSFRDVILEEHTHRVRKPIGLQLDLGGIGKGYIVDRVAKALHERYEHIFVYAGGDIRTFGANRAEGYEYWVSDIEDPRDGNRSVATLLLKDRAVATSGVNRRRWKSREGTKHHLIDPQTGRSAETDLVTSTVVANTAQQADVWAKTLCVLGSRRGMIRAKEKGIAALFVDLSGKVSYTDGMKQYIWQR